MIVILLIARGFRVLFSKEILPRVIKLKSVVILSKLITSILVGLTVICFCLYTTLSLISTSGSDYDVLDLNIEPEDLIWKDPLEDTSIKSARDLFLMDYRSSLKVSRGVIQCSGREGWEQYLNENSELVIKDTKEIKDKLYSGIQKDPKGIKQMFKDPEQRSKTKIFLDCIDTMANNKAQFRGRPIKAFMQLPDKETALEKALVATKASNPHLNLSWEELCRLYAFSYHTKTPFDLHNLHNYTPESFGEEMRNKFKVGYGNNLVKTWRVELSYYLDNNREEDLYAKLRIVKYVREKYPLPTKEN